MPAKSEGGDVGSKEFAVTGGSTLGINWQDGTLVYGLEKAWHTDHS
jgi:hypothetical protein